jgi:holo-[acyl-carrier protein] synthase
MIIGIGTDIIEIDRIGKALINKGFLHKNFTEKEIEYFLRRKNMCEVVAGNFAAKEAVSKALGTGFRGFGLIDIEVLRDELGKPKVNLYGQAKSIADKGGETKIHISISHNKTQAIAYCIIEAI